MHQGLLEMQGKAAGRTVQQLVFLASLHSFPEIRMSTCYGFDI